MKLVFVRHGHPNYKDDCLTELGHEQAEKASYRLLEEHIDEMYASSCGRAYETALHTAEKLSKEVIKLDFMREIAWCSVDNTEIHSNGHPWHVADYAVSLGYSLMDETWTRELPFSKSIVFSEIEKVASGIDTWLETLGYKREGSNYRVIGDNTDKTIALFSHGGSSTAAMSHMLNLPFFYLCGTLHLKFTSITVIRFSDEKGALVAPMIEYANDARHIETEDAIFQN